MWPRSRCRTSIAADNSDASRPDTNPTAPLAAGARALLYLWQSAPRDTILGAMLTIVQGLVSIAALCLIKLLVDTAGTVLPGGAAANVLTRVAWLVTAAGGVAIGGVALRAAAGVVASRQAQAVADHITNLLHSKCADVELAYFERATSLDAIHRAQRDAPSAPSRLVGNLHQIASHSVALIAVCALLVSFHPLLAFALLLFSLPSLIVRLRSADRTYSWERARTPDDRRAWYFHWMLTGERYAAELRYFALSGTFRARYRNIRGVLRAERNTLVRRQALAEFFAEAIAVAAVYAALGVLVASALRGNATPGEVILFYQAYQRAQTSLQEVLWSVGGLYADALFLVELEAFLARPPALPRRPRPAAVPRTFRNGVVVERVSFRYSESRRQALTDLSLCIEPGECVALVGRNGSGKTTLVKLLTRLHDVSSGRIMLDDVDLRQFDPEALRREISVIPQDFARYNLTLRENIALGDVAGGVSGADQGRVIAAAERAGLSALVEQLPRGYDTVLGTWFQNGEELSVGEWQKVALARALVRDAQLVILDEPTSGLDAEAEYEFFRTFRDAIQGRAVLLISHRMSTVRRADRIVVLDQGRRVEGGTHDELIRSRGPYADLFDRQASPYR